jgi:signal transduction histidine kinase
MESIGQAGEVGRLPFPERLRVLLSAALELTGPHELEEVLQRIVEGAATVAGARYAALGVYGDDGRITTFINHGFDHATVTRIGQLPEGRGLLGQVIVADRPIRLENIGADPRSCGFPPSHPPMRSFLGVPVVRGGRRYGNLYVTERYDGHNFDDDDEALVVALAAFAAGAVESAELVGADRVRAEARVERVAAEGQARARRELLTRIIAAQEAERARVARDLHDDVGQALTSVLLGLRLVEGSLDGPGVDVDDARRRSAELRQLVADALRRARRLAFDLRPTVLDDIGLAAALERLTADVAERTGLTVGLDVGLGADERLAPETETAVYRVVQEALTNVARHARAGQVSVTVAWLGDRVRALVEDDGAGFDVGARPPGGHLGLAGMDERARLVDGTVEVTSTAGQGTTVVLEVPRG